MPSRRAPRCASPFANRHAFSADSAFRVTGDRAQSWNVVFSVSGRQRSVQDAVLAARARASPNDTILACDRVARDRRCGCRGSRARARRSELWVRRGDRDGEHERGGDTGLHCGGNRGERRADPGRRRACGTATAATADTIVVSGNTGSETVTIDLSGGPFAPGATAERHRVPREIEFASTSRRARRTASRSRGARARTRSSSARRGEPQRRRRVDATRHRRGARDMSGSDGADLISGAGDATTGAPTSLALTLNGDSGDDKLSGGDGDDTIAGGTGDNALAGGSGDDTMTGGPDNDAITGGPGGDTLTGGLGNDAFDEGAASNGTDTMAGSGGIDRVTYAGRTASVAVPRRRLQRRRVRRGRQRRHRRRGCGRRRRGRHLTGSTADNDPHRRARRRRDRRRERQRHADRRLRRRPVTGAAGNDAVVGEAGADSVVDGAGNDTLNGGADADTLDYSTVAASVSVSLGRLAAGDRWSRERHGGRLREPRWRSGRRHARGQRQCETISSGAGNDTILGDAGDDTSTASSAPTPSTTPRSPAG